MIKTTVTDLLGIERPIIQGAMGYISTAPLAAAVSNAGGLGIITSAYLEGMEQLRREIRHAKELTSRPFGVNIVIGTADADDVAQLCIEEGVKVVTTGAGNPSKYIAAWKQAGIKVIPVVPSVRLALRMQEVGADAVVAEGTEAGGHVGEETTMSLIPAVADAVSIPVIGAGGIADGRSAAAAFMLGARAVQCGTVFICTPECAAHERYKQLVLESGASATTVTGRVAGHPVRAVNTDFVRRLAALERKGGGEAELERLATGSYPRAGLSGDMENGAVNAGQVLWAVKEMKPAAQIVQALSEGLERMLQSAAQLEGIRFE